MPAAVTLPQRIFDNRFIYWPGQGGGFLGSEWDPLMLTCEPAEEQFQIISAMAKCCTGCSEPSSLDPISSAGQTPGMIDADILARRREALAKLLVEEQVDALLISSVVNVTYLTGFSGDTSYLILGKDRTLLVSDGRYTEQIAEECPGLETYIRPPTQTITAAAVENLSKMCYRSVGFESSCMTVAEREKLAELCPAIAWKPGSDRVEKLRMVKDDSELAEIREAIAIAERAFDMFRAALRLDESEKDLSDAMEMHIRRAGGECSSFRPIVAADARAALPHAPPTRQLIADADLILVDWGASGPRYKSDLTRVLMARRFSVAGRSWPLRLDFDQLQKVYTAVRTAQEQAFRAIRPGAKAADVDAAARSAIAEAGFGALFVHGLGHGIGLQVHEGPGIRASSTDVLQAGMVFTIEPGIYLPGQFGVRIEDDVRVTEDGCEVLTHVARDWQEVV